MEQTPGGSDESKVPAAKRLNCEVDVGERVRLLISTITSTLFSYISQVKILGQYDGYDDVLTTNHLEIRSRASV
jgi:hypothetical protein